MPKILQPNQTIQEGGGLTSVIVPKQLTKLGVGIGFGVMAGATLGVEMFKQHNKMKMGPVSYTGGPDRMTHNITSGAVEAIQQVTKDPAVQQDMIKKMMHSTNDGMLNNIDEYGVDSEFLSAFYGM